MSLSDFARRNPTYQSIQTSLLFPFPLRQSPQSRSFSLLDVLPDTFHPSKCRPQPRIRQPRFHFQLLDLPLQVCGLGIRLSRLRSQLICFREELLRVALEELEGGIVCWVDTGRDRSSPCFGRGGSESARGGPRPRSRAYERGDLGVRHGSVMNVRTMMKPASSTAIDTVSCWKVTRLRSGPRAYQKVGCASAAPFKVKRQSRAHIGSNTFTLYPSFAKALQRQGSATLADTIRERQTQHFGGKRRNPAQIAEHAARSSFRFLTLTPATRKESLQYVPQLCWGKQPYGWKIEWEGERGSTSFR
jgi:hypothetical protein